MQLQQDRLFVLIKSLNQGEKVYFSKYSRVHHAKEKPDYLRLFEFIDTQEEYDEKAVIKHFKGDKFIKQLPRKKTQLKEKIMESLSIFHADRTVETSLRKQMILLPVLYEKATQHKDLVKDYEKQLKDIKKTAEKHECFSVLIELFEWENLLLKLLDNNKRENKILLSLDHRLGLLNQLSNELELMDTAIRVKLIASKDPKFKTPENRETLESLVQNKLEINNVESLSLIAKRQYYYLQSEYYGTQNKWEIAHQAAKKLIDSYSDEDRIDIIATHKYKNDLCNYLFISDCAQKVDNYLTTINKLDALSSKDDMRMFNTIQFKLLIYHLNNYNFESAKETSKNIESKWNELCTFIPKRRQLAYHYNIMVAYWFGGDPTTMYWLSKILTFENNKEGQRYVNLSRIVQLPICYDYDYENLENRIESARKVLKSRSELNEYRKTIISYFRRLVRCVSNQDKKECIFDMQTKLNKIQSEQNINSGDLGCILLWCKLKLGEKIVKNQLQQSPKSNFFKTKL